MWQSLWWKLSLGSIAVTLVGSTLAALLLSPVQDAHGFKQVVKPAHLRQLIEPELRVLQGRRQDRALVAQMLDAMQQRLLNVDGPEGYYGIRESSDPMVSLALFDDEGRRVALRENPALALPDRWQPGPLRLEAVSAAERLLVLPLGDGGTLMVRHYARFDVWKNLRSALRDAGSFFGWMVLLMALPGIMLGVGLTWWLAYRLRRLARMTEGWARGDFSMRLADDSRDELGEHARAINQVAGQLQTHVETNRELAALQERQRLARELHDSIKQQVFATGLQLHAAQQWLERQPAKAAQLLAEAAAQNQAVHRDLSGLLSRLKPLEASRRQDLREELALRLQPWQAHLELSLEVPGGLALPFEQAHELASIANEAVANALRHGGARRVRLGWSAEAGHAELVIADEGRGFDAGQTANGHGLTNMFERAAALPGGALFLDAAPGRGCRLAVRFQFQEEPSR
ncbi:HAMP domain-containing protein [Roseateles sp. DAIF2]|uniref:HAMP domain-containing sensor histidine kinase n=1 Tax=Roseateles sp. DAIF2 TaxID=2714952 RepID=UPI0018A2BD43|nr:histidine kinase [Roseateles sp. DAIF2]QPF72436.1 HAMP domain-containing protein [Roseateles sp. DAIF2]